MSARTSQYQMLANQGSDWARLAAAMSAFENVMAELYEIV